MYNARIMYVRDNKIPIRKRLASNPIAYADMEERYNEGHPTESHASIHSDKAKSVSEK